MTCFVLTLMVVAAICSATLKWRRASKILFVSTFILFLAIGCGPLPAWLLRNLQAPYRVNPPIAWGARNAIILLGAGTVKISNTGLVEPAIFSYPRIVTAAVLYNDCRKTKAECKILISGGDALHNGVSEAVAYRRTLIRLGVQPTDI